MQKLSIGPPALENISSISLRKLSAMASMMHALPIVIQNLQIQSDVVTLICSVEGVCTTWRAAVAALQGSNHPLDVELEAGEASAAAWLRTINSFSCWLLRHTALVRSISISKGTGEDAEQVSTSIAGQEVLGKALMLMQAYGTSEAAALVLQLQRYSSDCMGSNHILQALPAASVTSLELHLPMHSRADPAFPSCQGLSAAFTRLSNLQALSLVFAQQQVLSPSCCHALAGLSHLTNLELGVQLQPGGVDALTAALSQLPKLQQLHLRCRFEAWQGLDLVPLLHVTELQLQLLGLQLSPSCLVQVPRQVRALGIWLDPACSWSSSAATVSETTGGIFEPIANLPELQWLQICSVSTPQALPGFLFSQLQQLTQLSSISLGFQSQGAAQGNCQHWVHLRHLKRLSIASTAVMDKSHAELEQLLRSVGANNGLTGLKMCIDMPSRQSYRQLYAAGLAGAARLDVEGMTVFQHLTGLKQLQELHLTLGPHRWGLLGDVLSARDWQAFVDTLQVAPGSAKCLTGLTNLTSLQLESFGEAVNKAAALALASHLTGLKYLDLRGCRVGTTLAFIQLHKLPLLEELVLHDADDDDSWEQ